MLTVWRSRARLARFAPFTDFTRRAQNAHFVATPRVVGAFQKPFNDLTLYLMTFHMHDSFEAIVRKQCKPFAGTQKLTTTSKRGMRLRIVWIWDPHPSHLQQQQEQPLGVRISSKSSSSPPLLGGAAAGGVAAAAAAAVLTEATEMSVN